MKKYILIAGVNGAGKSTLYQTLQSLQDMPRVNTDEILKEFGDWKNPADVMTAGKIAVKQIQQYFSEGISFNQETTLCGKSILNNIKKAKKEGYVIELHYVGVESAAIAMERVLKRVKQGGHGIPKKDIDRRFINSFYNLKIVLPDCDLAAFYDNTIKFHRFAIYKNGRPLRISQHVPEWFKNISASSSP
ncbi:MAG: ATPase [Lachnospiraceae bacterium]|jgi:predicted ABC-type ATPase|nr:ATPase [Lachnospiraceae bacterium]MCI9479720.1 ATPase [Lachnospiraceae bacterium]MCI9624363.1 ATPase [Lachnospiraceae bacterium]GFI10827.1 hypothetical protein IMSAGC007_03298 [Lachnospiraceae bacterium]